jgi:Uri superfamily endonuclease
LFKWLYVNSSGSSSGKSSVSLYFSRIEASVWEILVSYILNEKGSEELVVNEFNKLEDEINKISNSFFKRSYEKKLFVTSNKLIQTISKKNKENGGKLIESLFFEKIF